METERIMSPEETGAGIHEQRLATEEEISQQVESARDKGKTKAGYPRAVSGAGRRGKVIKGPHPHNKQGRIDRSRKETIRDRA